MDSLKQARVAALSLEQGASLVRLLKAHGRGEHAAHMEAALRQAREILGKACGRERLSDAIDWVADRSTAAEPSPAIPTLQ